MKKKGFKLALFMALFVWLIVGLATVWGKGGVHEILKAKEKEKKLQQEIEFMKIENLRLKNEINTLRTAPESYEVFAREKLFMKKPNEIVIYIVDEDDKNKKK